MLIFGGGPAEPELHGAAREEWIWVLLLLWVARVSWFLSIDWQIMRMHT